MITQGTVLNDTYKIIEEIGSGGGGVVYKAQHLRLDTEVVVKRIRDEAVGKIASRGEADILKTLKHSYLPRIYDFIEQEDGIYTIMDFIPGEGLDKILARKTPISQKQLVKWAQQLGEALQYLHSQKPEIIHSDIKPANIIITPEGNVCLIDFNISTVSDASGRRISQGFSAGYSAPEQYRNRTTSVNIPTSKLLSTKPQIDGEETEYISSEGDQERTEYISSENDSEGTEYISEDVQNDDKTEMLLSNGENSEAEDDKTEVLSESYESSQVPSNVKVEFGYVDKRSDIYSLGCVLYHMASRVSPGRDYRKVIPLHETNTKVSEGLIFIIEKMMEINPDKRFQDGAEFYKAITNIYKYDKRYIAHHRKEKAFLAVSCVLLLVGGALIGTGLREINIEKIADFETAITNADLLAESGDTASAINTVKKYQSDSVDPGRAYEREVYYLYLFGDYDNCIKQGEEYISAQYLSSKKDSSNLANMFYIIGNAYYEKEEYAPAANYFSQAVDYYDMNALFYRDLSVTYAKLGHINEAQDALDKAVALDMAEDSISFAQGELEFAKGNKDAASDYLNKVINTSSDQILRKRAVLLNAQLLLESGRIDEEIELLNDALLQAGNQERLVMKDYLATAYMRKGDVLSSEDEDAAIQYYNESADIYESIINDGYATWQAKENLAILREEAKQFDAAEAVLLKMAEEYPSDYRVYKRLALLEADKQMQIENELRDYAAMKEYYDKAVELYDTSINEMEMQMLDNLIDDLKRESWID